MAIGRSSWSVGDHVRVYRRRTGAFAVIEEDEPVTGNRADNHDYDVEHYARLLRATFAVRLERAFTPTDYAALFADPNQMSLFAPRIEEVQTTLTKAVRTA